ncbi:MAG: PEGA domain-containing protein [Lachnospirales bacterium]
MAEISNNELINHNRKKRRGVIPIVLIISLAIGLIVGAMSFFISYKYMITDSADEIPQDSFSANDMAGQVQANLIGSDIDAVVKSVDASAKTITFYNLKNDTTTTVNATENTTYPKEVTFESIKIGDIFTYVFDKDKNITEIKTCKDEWVIEDVGLAVSTSAKMLKFGDMAEKYAGTSYKYVDSLTTVRFNNEYLTLENISPMDYVMVKGYDNGRVNKAYSVTIKKSHGELQIQNINYIDNVKLEINGKTYTPSTEDPRMILTEGTYNIIITGDNCEPTSKEVIIDPSKPFVIDLSQIMVKAGALDVSTNVRGCKIYINNKEYQEGETILLEYGKYEVRATKDGYNEAKGQVTIDADNNYIDLDLDKIDKSGTVSITASPSNAEIFIDGISYGTGSVTKNVALGSYVVSASASGYNTEKKQINVTAEGQQINVNLNLSSAQ